MTIRTLADRGSVVHENLGYPRRSRMAAIARGTGLHVIRCLSRRHHVVVTGCTGARRHARMIESNRRPNYGGMAAIASLGGRNMLLRFRGRRDTVAGAVAGFALFRGALEHATYVTLFTLGLRVRTGQRKTGS